MTRDEITSYASSCLAAIKESPDIAADIIEDIFNRWLHELPE